MRISWNNSIDRRARRGWFAETLVVLGILAFAYFAVSLQGQRTAEPAPAAIPGLTIG